MLQGQGVVLQHLANLAHQAIRRRLAAGLDRIERGSHLLSILSCEGAKDVAIEFGSMSKSHNMAGWRIGWITGRKDYIDTIRAVAEGHKVLPPAMTTSLFTQIVESALTGGQDLADKPFQLTAREKEIISLISEGLSNKEIAVRLHIATHTVKSHVHNILEKLALGSRLQIAAFARRKPPE